MLFSIFFLLLNMFPNENHVHQIENQSPVPAFYYATDSLPDPLTAGWRGGEVCELLKENERFRTLKCTFPPGGGHDKHFHAPHFGYALSGSRFRIEDEKGIREVDLKTGSHFTSEGVKWHSVLNIGDSTSVYLIFEPK